MTMYLFVVDMGEAVEYVQTDISLSLSFQTDACL